MSAVSVGYHNTKDQRCRPVISAMCAFTCTIGLRVWELTIVLMTVCVCVCVCACASACVCAIDQSGIAVISLIIIIVYW